MDKSLLGEFQLDWKLSGKAASTATNYAQWIEHLLSQHPEPTLVDVKEWIASTPSVSFRRKRGQAVRAFVGRAKGQARHKVVTQDHICRMEHVGGTDGRGAAAAFPPGQGVPTVAASECVGSLGTMAWAAQRDPALGKGGSQGCLTMAARCVCGSGMDTVGGARSSPETDASIRKACDGEVAAFARVAGILPAENAGHGPEGDADCGLSGGGTMAAT